jgi:hypothetical protein
LFSSGLEPPAVQPIVYRYTTEPSQSIFRFVVYLLLVVDRLCGLVVRVPGYSPTGPRFDSQRYHLSGSGSPTGFTLPHEDK